MLAELISKIRKDKHITKAYLARKANINVGHLAHIEKGERTPSHKALKKICETLDVPYQSLMYTYDKELNETHKSYDLIKHISYNSVLAIDSINNLIPCPGKFATAAIAIKVEDNAMDPKIKEGSYAFVEFNSPLNSRDIGLFFYNNKFLIRRFLIRKTGLLLNSLNPDFPDISLSEKDSFYIIGKIIGTNADS